MDNVHIPKNLLYEELAHFPRPLGQPKFRFKDIYKRNLKTFNIDTTSWEDAASNRLCWARESKWLKRWG